MTRRSSKDTYVTWFNRAIFVGALINIFGMGLPFVFAPQWYLDFFGLPGGGGSLIWMRQAGFLLSFISTLYIVGGREPLRYSLNAKFAVLVRIVIGSYWFWLVFADGQPRSFLVFGILDLAYAAFSGVLLWLVLKKRN